MLTANGIFCRMCRTCGGEFVKIAEPEEFTRKQAAKAARDARRGGTKRARERGTPSSTGKKTRRSDNGVVPFSGTGHRTGTRSEGSQGGSSFSEGNDEEADADTDGWRHAHEMHESDVLDDDDDVKGYSSGSGSDRAGPSHRPNAISAVHGQDIRSFFEGGTDHAAAIGGAGPTNGGIPAIESTPVRKPGRGSGPASPTPPAGPPASAIKKDPKPARDPPAGPASPPPSAASPAVKKEPKPSSPEARRRLLADAAAARMAALSTSQAGAPARPASAPKPGSQGGPEVIFLDDD